jgi:hypothetical protein
VSAVAIKSLFFGNRNFLVFYFHWFFLIKETGISFLVIWETLYSSS